MPVKAWAAAIGWNAGGSRMDRSARNRRTGPVSGGRHGSAS